jgi:hypothetical protein
MNKWIPLDAIVGLAAVSLVGLSLAGCQSIIPGAPSSNAVQAQIVSGEQQVYGFVCPTLTSGALDVVATSFNANVQLAYSKAKQLCNVGVIQTAGDFAAAFVIIQPIVQAYFGDVKFSV